MNRERRAVNWACIILEPQKDWKDAYDTVKTIRKGLNFLLLINLLVLSDAFKLIYVLVTVFSTWYIRSFIFYYF